MTVEYIFIMSDNIAALDKRDAEATVEVTEAAEIVVDRCNTMGCHKTAAMACPTCLKLGLPVATSRFCSQECFKNSWGAHKLVHKSVAAPPAVDVDLTAVPPEYANYTFTGPLRPGSTAVIPPSPPFDSVPSCLTGPCSLSDRHLSGTSSHS